MKRRNAANPPQDEADLRHLQQELEIHQAELELQNENLLESQAELETSLERHTDFYDFAPVGYLTLGRDGEIRQLNPKAAKLFGAERSDLVTRRLGQFVCVAVRLRVGTLAPEEAPAEHRFPIDAKPPAGPCACLEVTEPGCGIAEGDLKDLFDPYYSNKFPGRGMGLALVLGIVRVHEGAIAVESKPGRGTTFRVYLPLAAEAGAQPPGKGKGAAVSGRGKVLLAEDDEGVRMMTAKLLARMGFEVIQAVDGAEAVELFAKRKDEIQWVLSDVRMPRMDGWEVLAAVRKLCPGIPVVLASGYDPLSMDADDYPDQPQMVLSKPYGFAELHEAIEKVIAEGI